MTRHPTARRVHHQDSAPDDVFVARVLETSAWAKQNSRMLVIGGIIAAVLVIGLAYFVTSRRAQNAQAAAQLTQVRAVVMSGNNPLAIRELEQYLARFGGTSSADEARLMLGRAYLHADQAQQAQEIIAPLADDMGSGLGNNAALLLASTYEAAQEPHRAEEIYLQMAEEARFLFQQQDALDNAARIRLQRGDAAGAVELYERLLEITPESNTERPIFEMRLGEARALAAVGGTITAAAPPPPPASAPGQVAPQPQPGQAPAQPGQTQPTPDQTPTPEPTTTGQ
ncbi:MAG TPA: tetratricopeptide repeat protein [Longimicrobiales bacterium]|nr:tetratricopeptide repeat protein [Longimicrobiales bacterium]